MNPVMWLDDIGRPAWIALMIVSFVMFWPVGLVVLGFLIGSGRMACWTMQGGGERWQRRMERMQQRMQARASRWCGPGWGGGWGTRDGTAGLPRPRAATTHSTNTAPRPCAASKRKSASSRNFSTACARPRTRPSSTSSWPRCATARKGRRRSRCRNAARSALYSVRLCTWPPPLPAAGPPGRD